MAKIELPKQISWHGNILKKVRGSYRDLRSLSPQADPAREKLNLKLSIFQLKRTFRVS